MNEATIHASPSVDPKVVVDNGEPTVLLAPVDDAESDFESAGEGMSAQGMLYDPDIASKHDSKHSNFSNSHSPSKSTKRTTRQRVKSIGHNAKRKSKNLLESTKAKVGLSQPTQEDSDSPYAELNNDPAFEPAHLSGSKRVTAGGTADRLLGAATATVNAISHPRRGLKRTAATKIAVEDRPYLSDQADAEYLDAHKDLSKARSSSDFGRDDESVIERKENQVDDFDKRRDGKRVAWTTSRHVHRVMVVPKRDVKPPNSKAYYIVDPKTGKKTFDWIGYVSAYNRYNLKNLAYNRMGNVDPASSLPFDKDIMMKYLERLIMASAPWQSWFLKLRQLYRWDDPKQTCSWLAVWFCVWWMDYIMTFTLGWVAFIVLENRFFPKRVDTLRESHDRSLDLDTDAVRLNELISRHGSSDWLEPVLEKAGPLIQMQLRDLADFLEILNNFYDWRRPSKTWATLFWFACAILLAMLTSTQYSMKIIWMFCLLSFFLGRPIASKHPQYRHVVNALKWIFWEIPTDAEWSFMYLRNKAQATRANIISDKISDLDQKVQANRPTEAYGGIMDIPHVLRTETVDEADESFDSDGASWHTADSSTSILGGLDLLSFRCRHKGIQGRLIIYSSGLRFVRSSPLKARRKERWRHEFLDLTEMRKTNLGTVGKALAMVDGLTLRFVDGDVIKLERVKGRDRAFNCILGFSGLQYMVLQPVEENMEEMKSGVVDDGDEDLAEQDMNKPEVPGPFE